VNYDNITNCITEIPQDIKVSLSFIGSNGTLTLNAGSKFYLGNGTVKTTTKELTLRNTGSAQMFLHIKSDGTGLYAGYMNGGTVSERPTSPANYASYYNTSTQKCEFYNGTNWFEISLPIAIVTRGADGFVSIDQVFNGFGYIGSTVFALPGVKGLIPNGRNADGSLKNAIYTTPKVITFERNLTGDNIPVFLRGNNTFAISTGLLYDEINNIVGTGGYFQVGNIDMNAGVISNFQPKTPFRAVDYNDAVKYSDKSTIVSWGMPNYSAAVSISEDTIKGGYTAPSNGFVIVSGQPMASSTVTIGGKNFTASYSVGTSGTPVPIPCKKGTVVKYSSFYVFHTAMFVPCSQ
jgi:hypothetical protein